MMMTSTMNVRPTRLLLLGCAFTVVKNIVLSDAAPVDWLLLITVVEKFVTLLIRPPGTVVPGGLMFCC